MGKYDQSRRRLVELIAEETRYTRAYTGRDQLDPRVVAAIERVHREQFVPPAMTAFAYDNSPLPIGHGQTISQPYIVALMTDLLECDDGAVVLEIGTGSGYQAAVLAQVAKRVYSVEIVRPLGEQAAERLQRLGYDNVAVRIGDGYFGWPEYAPYDAIMVTAAAPEVPAPLIEQLKPGGRMSIPVDRPAGPQELLLVTKDADGSVHQRDILPVSFVPLTGDHRV